MNLLDLLELAMVLIFVLAGGYFVRVMTRLIDAVDRLEAGAKVIAENLAADKASRPSEPS